MIFQRSFLIPLLLSPLGLLIPLAPRSGPLLVLLLGIAGLVHYVRYRPSLDWLRGSPVYLLGAFLVYIFLSAIWSVTPERSFEQAVRLSALAFFGLAAFSLVRSLTDSQRDRVVKCLTPALIIGIFTGSLYGLLQYTGPSLRTMADFLSLNPELLQFQSQRLHIAKTLLVTNLAFFSLLPWLWQRQKALAIIAYFSFLPVCFYSDSQAAFVTCITGGGVFLISKISAKWATQLFAAGLIGGMLLAVPLTQSSNMSESLQSNTPRALMQGSSIKLRLQIYKFFGEQISKRPILGHGLEAGVKYVAPNIDYQKIDTGVRTPHNVFLQIIFDLGYLGAALTLLVLLLPIRQLYMSRAPHFAAAFVLPICVMIAATLFNFVIWRTWIPGATILSALFIFIQAQQTLENGNT